MKKLSITRTLFRFLAISALTVTAVAPSAHAWKPITHVHLAEEARKEAIDPRGTLTVPQIDFWQGVTKPDAVGNYTVATDVRDALTQYPQYFRAGVLGPDAYPDIVTGQRVIHPGEANDAGGTDAWLKRLWSAREAGNLPQIAFVLGFLSHAAGDMFGHTLINDYTGGPFTFQPPKNAITHIVVEGYIGKHTPALDDYSIDTSAVNAFIYSTLIDAIQAPDGQATNEVWDLMEKEWQTTLPGLFTHLRAGLLDVLEAHSSHDRYLTRRVKYYKSACINVFRTPISCAQEAAARFVRGTYRTIMSPVADYLDAWIDDINRGLRAWPATSTEVARHMFMTRSHAADLNGTKAVLEAYYYDHLLSMLGAPDRVAAALQYFDAVMDRLLEILAFDPFKEIKEDLLNFMLEKATGMNRDQLESYLTDPDSHLDRVAPGKRAELNRMMGLPNNENKLRWRVFPAAYNTTTMTKLSFLGSTEVLHLLRDLGFAGTPPALEDNILLGYIHSLDGDNQWQENDQQMILQTDCYLYTKVFMQQTGDDHDATHPQLFPHHLDGHPVRLCPDVSSLVVTPVPGLEEASPGCASDLLVDIRLNMAAGPLGAVVDLSDLGDTFTEDGLPGHVWIRPGQDHVSRVPIFMDDVDPVRYAGRGSVAANITAERFESYPALVKSAAPYVERIDLDRPSFLSSSQVTGRATLGCAYGSGTLRIRSNGFAEPTILLETTGYRTGDQIAFNATALACTAGQYTVSAEYPVGVEPYWTGFGMGLREVVGSRVETGFDLIGGAIRGIEIDEPTVDIDREEIKYRDDSLLQDAIRGGEIKVPPMSMEEMVIMSTNEWLSRMDRCAEHALSGRVTFCAPPAPATNVNVHSEQFLGMSSSTVAVTDATDTAPFTVSYLGSGGAISISAWLDGQEISSAVVTAVSHSMCEDPGTALRPYNSGGGRPGPDPMPPL